MWLPQICTADVSLPFICAGFTATDISIDLCFLLQKFIPSWCTKLMYLPLCENPMMAARRASSTDVVLGGQHYCWVPSLVSLPSLYIWIWQYNILFINLEFFDLRKPCTMYEFSKLFSFINKNRSHKCLHFSVKEKAHVDNNHGWKISFLCSSKNSAGDLEEICCKSYLQTDKSTQIPLDLKRVRRKWHPCWQGNMDQLSSAETISKLLDQFAWICKVLLGHERKKRMSTKEK